MVSNPCVIRFLFIFLLPSSLTKLIVSLAGETRAWCYTSDPNARWDYCDVPYCESSLDGAATSSTRGPIAGGAPTLPPTIAPTVEPTVNNIDCSGNWWGPCKNNHVFPEVGGAPDDAAVNTTEATAMNVTSQPSNNSTNSTEN